MNPDHQRAVIHEMVAGRGAPRLSAAIESLVPVSRPLAHYLGGLASVLRQSAVGGGVNYLFGKSSVHGFPFYFFAAFALKSSIAFLAVTAVTLVSFLRRPTGLAEEARLFLLPSAILFLSSIGSAYNIGIRHMLPVYPFLALAAAAVFVRAAAARDQDTRGGPAPAALALLALPLVAGYELLRIHPVPHGRAGLRGGSDSAPGSGRDLGVPPRRRPGIPRLSRRARPGRRASPAERRARVPGPAGRASGLLDLSIRAPGRCLPSRAGRQ